MKRTKGFTLIEILFVIGIISLPLILIYHTMPEPTQTAPKNFEAKVISKQINTYRNSGVNSNNGRCVAVSMHVFIEAKNKHLIAITDVPSYANCRIEDSYQFSYNDNLLKLVWAEVN